MLVVHMFFLRVLFLGCHRLVEVFNNSSLDITKGSSNYGYVAYYALNVKKGRGSEVVNQNGYLFYTYDETNYLLGYAGAETELTLPENYNGKSYLIYEYAFYDCADLTSIEIPNSVTAICDYAFYWCTELKSVTIDSSVTSIDTGAFEIFPCGCANSKEASLGESRIHTILGWKIN